MQQEPALAVLGTPNIEGPHVGKVGIVELGDDPVDTVSKGGGGFSFSSFELLQREPVRLVPCSITLGASGAKVVRSDGRPPAGQCLVFRPQVPEGPHRFASSSAAAMKLARSAWNLA